MEVVIKFEVRRNAEPLCKCAYCEDVIFLGGHTFGSVIDGKYSKYMDLCGSCAEIVKEQFKDAPGQ